MQAENSKNAPADPTRATDLIIMLKRQILMLCLYILLLRAHASRRVPRAMICKVIYKN